SIFGEEICDLRPEKRKWQPLNIIISLMPQKSMSLAEAYAQIDLHIICTDKYPDEVPNIQLENSKGLSHQQVAVLHNDLVQLAKQLQGEVMIFDLAQHVQIYLHEHNKPSYSSFYEEMVSRHQEKIKNEKLEKQLKEDKERQILQDEIQKRRQEALRAERSLCNEQTNDASLSIPSSSSPEKSQFLCKHKGTKLLNFDYQKGI
ncbi:Eukaryotic translation initiation factor 2-alpha kinase 4, partial [Melipona quadrifasciata]